MSSYTVCTDMVLTLWSVLTRATMIICLYVERIRELRLVFKHRSVAAVAFEISMWIRSFHIIFIKKNTRNCSQWIS
jgi:hypothetical protein